MKNIDVKIWDMDDGKITSLNIGDAIVPLINPVNCFEKYPFKVAHDFAEIFDIGHIRKNNTVKDTEVKNTDDTETKNKSYAITELSRPTHIDVNVLKLLFNHFKDQDFTSSDVYKYTRGKFDSLDTVGIYSSLKRIQERGIIKSTTRYRDGIQNEYYRVVVPPFKIKNEELDNKDDFKLIQPDSMFSDTIIGYKNKIPIPVYKLKTLYFTLKNVSSFSLYDALNALRDTTGYSISVVRACMSYLVDRGYATCVYVPPHNKKLYSFLVPASCWVFETDVDTEYKNTCCAQNNQYGPDVIIRPISPKMDQKVNS